MDSQGEQYLYKEKYYAGIYVKTKAIKLSDLLCKWDSNCLADETHVYRSH